MYSPSVAEPTNQSRARSSPVTVQWVYYLHPHLESRVPDTNLSMQQLAHAHLGLKPESKASCCSACAKPCWTACSLFATALTALQIGLPAFVYASCLLCGRSLHDDVSSPYASGVYCPDWNADRSACLCLGFLPAMWTCVAC